jgi:undecaprenyl-diphosphatase
MLHARMRLHTVSRVMAGFSDLGIAVATGLLQSATEFLPVSSSGHICLLAMLFPVPEMSLALILLVHNGTLLATVLVFRKDIAALIAGCFRGLKTPRALLRAYEGRLAAALLVSSASTAAVGLPLRNAVVTATETPWVVGLGFLGSALAVLLTRNRQGSDQVPSLAAATLIGLAQGIAVLPGLSRSGVSIACAMVLKLSPPAAFRYSFLLSIPAVAGATLLEMSEIGDMDRPGATAWIAASVSFLAGLAALGWLGRIVKRGQLWRFAWYLVPLGAVTLWLDVIT